MNEYTSIHIYIYRNYHILKTAHCSIPLEDLLPMPVPQFNLPSTSISSLFVLFQNGFGHSCTFIILLSVLVLNSLTILKHKGIICLHLGYSERSAEDFEGSFKRGVSSSI